MIDIKKIQENEKRLSEKYGRSLRDIRRKDGYDSHEYADVSKEINELLEFRSAFSIKRQQVHRLISKIASDCFMYYPGSVSDNDVESVETLDYYDNVRIHVRHVIEEDKVRDFCDRTGLELVDIQVDGHYFEPQCTYIFAFDREKPEDPCEGCISDIECNECEYNGYY